MLNFNWIVGRKLNTSDEMRKECMKKILSETRYVSGLKRMIVRAIQGNTSVLKDATLANIFRIHYLSIVILTIRLIMLRSIWTKSISPDLEIWKKGILGSHMVLMLFMAVIFTLTFRHKGKRVINKWLSYLPYTTSVFVMLMGITITAFDQYITTNMSPFIISSIVVGTVILIRPLASFIIYLSSYFIYYHAMELVIVEEAQLFTNRVNGISISAAGFLLSVILWHYFYTTTTQKRRIDMQQQKLELLAYRDSWMKLPNRRHFDDLLDQEILAIERDNHESIILLVDIDDFKNVNDAFGHPVGDKVLKEFSFFLKDTIREQDTVARIGGEEFIVLMPNLTLEEAVFMQSV